MTGSSPVVFPSRRSRPIKISLRLNAVSSCPQITYAGHPADATPAADIGVAFEVLEPPESADRAARVSLADARRRVACALADPRQGPPAAPDRRGYPAAN
jgi:hypothetical protein